MIENAYFFTVIVIFVHLRNDLFLVTGSQTMVSTNFSPNGSFLYVVLAQAFLPYNESQGETKFCFHCSLSILYNWYKIGRAQ